MAPLSLLFSPQRDAVSTLARDFLDDAEKAALSPLSEKALHDFRVALRQLRTILRAFPEVNRGVVPESLQIALKRLAHGTNASRDTEVTMEWLKRAKRATSRKDNAQITALLSRFTTEVARHRHRFSRQLVPQFSRVSARLKHLLEVNPSDHHRGRADSAPFSQGLAQVLKVELEIFDARFQKARRALRTGKPRAKVSGRFHKLRITTKVLRYLLKPVAQRNDTAQRAHRKLSRLQSLLGEIHDRDQILQMLRKHSAPKRLIVRAKRERRELLERAKQELKRKSHHKMMQAANGVVAILTTDLSPRAENPIPNYNGRS